MMLARLGRVAMIAGLCAFASGAGAADALIKGEVKKIDETAGKITLRHGPIPSLGMDEPTMTMVFHVKDPSLLKQVKVGDKVRFEVGEDGEGLAVTRLEKAK